MDAAVTATAEATITKRQIPDGHPEHSFACNRCYPASTERARRPWDNPAFVDAGWSSQVARRAHNPEVVAFEPLATEKKKARSRGPSVSSGSGSIRSSRASAAPPRGCAMDDEGDRVRGGAGDLYKAYRFWEYPEIWVGSKAQELGFRTAARHGAAMRWRSALRGSPRQERCCSEDRRRRTRVGRPLLPANDDWRARRLSTGASWHGRRHNRRCDDGGGRAEPRRGTSAIAAHSVWYSWTAPAGGVLVLMSQNSTFDPAVAAYTGASLPALSLKGRGDLIEPLGHRDAAGRDRGHAGNDVPDRRGRQGVERGNLHAALVPAPFVERPHPALHRHGARRPPCSAGR